MNIETSERVLVTLHNYAMEFLSENGIIGFLFFLTFFIWIIFNKILNLKKYLKIKKVILF